MRTKAVDPAPTALFLRYIVHGWRAKEDCVRLPIVIVHIHICENAPNLGFHIYSKSSHFTSSKS